MTNKTPRLSRKEFLKLSAATMAGGMMMTSGVGRAMMNQNQSSDLLMRPIPSSGEMIPAVGLGTAQTFGQPENDEAFNQRKEVINTLLNEGGTVIDTSPTYSNAEAVVGRALDELGRRDEAWLATKISISGKQAGIDQNKQSYSDLKTNKFELLQVHNLRDTEAHMATIMALKEEGRVQYTGITHFRESANDPLTDAMLKYPVDFIQCQYNMIDRSVEQRLLPAALEKGVAIMINVPFGRGRLFRATSGQEIPEFAKEFGVDTWGKFFLKYILSHPAVTVAIPGTVHPHHVVDNIGALRGRLPDQSERDKMIKFIENL